MVIGERGEIGVERGEWRERGGERGERGEAKRGERGEVGK